tara:strand:- start:42768 stop:43157 length:390 start_codon:yes stop_codon:yes gene_type:complete
VDKGSKDIFFVEIHEPAEVRRNILESLKDIVENLQRFEKFKRIREDKIKNINDLRKTIKEVNKLIPNLRKALPDVKVRAAKIERHKGRGKKKTSSKDKGKEEVKEKPLTELQKLESELNEIEGKLGNLG